MELFHCWPGAPPEVEFLAVRHRHEFHFECYKRVLHADRDTEFILLKRELEQAVRDKSGEQETIAWSCEHWAMWLAEAYGLSRVVVAEDGENGAEVCRAGC